ncbi:MAG TPA: divalent-cation tolerance protein CutA [bacterium]|nr:divalent-cation tolerance protein CutA [bacterium]
MHTGHIVALTTFDKREDAERVARILVERRLAACVQMVAPMTSVYRWKGTVETATETLCLIKTRRDLFPQIERAMAELHPYEVPELVALPVEMGGAPYLKWIDAETAK